MLIAVGYGARAGASPLSEELTLVRSVPGMLAATVGLALLIAVVFLSVRIARRRLRYETWYFVHLYTYLALALSFSHQLSSGQAFAGDRVARGYWILLWGGTLATCCCTGWALRCCRSRATTCASSASAARAREWCRSRSRAAAWSSLGARAGQFFLWRFLTPGRWHEAHPFSLSAVPDGRRLRITVKALGDHTARLARLRPGTRVLAEGPYGAFTDERRRRDSVLYIAGGIGITPIRALLGSAPPGATLLYRAIGRRDLVLRDEIENLARERGVAVHYLLGDHREARARNLLSPRHLRRLVPDLRARDIFLCGPPAMADAARRALRAAGVPGGQVHVERFAL